MIRVTGLTFEPPDQLLAHPNNPRTHPPAQREALRAALNEIGWIGAVIQNDLTGNLIDGHMRVEEALSDGYTKIPVLHVELDHEEEALALATFDPITAMARYDRERLDDLLATTDTDDERLTAILDDLNDRAPELPDDDDMSPTFGDPTEFRTLALTYTLDRYEDVVSIIDPFPGSSPAEKLYNALLTLVRT